MSEGGSSSLLNNVQRLESPVRGGSRQEFKASFFERHGKEIFHLLAIILLSYLFLFYALGHYSLKEPDEGRYAEIPREMLETGEYVVPQLNYVRYFEKPPLLYWAVACSYKAFGVSEWSFRFVNSLFAFFSALLLYLLSRRSFGANAAFLASIILISSFGFFCAARIVTTDMCFSFLLFSSLLCFYDFYRNKANASLYLFYGMAGFATLAKGPVAVILLGGAILIFLLTEKRLSFLKELKLFKGSVIYACVVMPWIIAISLKEPEFLYFFFVDQHILRFATTQHNRSGPIYYFLPVILMGMFPWSFFIPRSVNALRHNRDIRLFIIWSAVVLLFFSLSGSKLPPYILPIFPALSLVLGIFFEEYRTNRVRKAWEMIPYIAAFTIFSLAAIPYIYPPFISLLLPLSHDVRAIAQELTYFSLGISAVSCAIVCVYVYICFRKALLRYDIVLVTLLCFSFSFVAMLTGFGISTLDKLNTSKQLALAVSQRKGGYDYLISYEIYERTFQFYTKSRLILVNYIGELRMGSSYEDAQGSFITEQDFVRLLSSDNKVLFVTKANKIDRLRPMVSKEIGTIACQNKKCLYEN